jgi:two-component system OmpR family response regulator
VSGILPEPLKVHLSFILLLGGGKRIQQLGLGESAMRVLIIEDEVRLAANVSRILEEQAKYVVDIANDGEEGRYKALVDPYDLIVLDLMLPKVDGLTILRDLRAEGKRTPVLILTAKDTTEDIVRGLDYGCDDYLTKPFEMGELVARARALIRRSYDRPEPVVQVGRITLNTSSRAVFLGGRQQYLPAMEYRLLEYMALRAGETVSKSEILEHLYGFDAERYSNVIEVYVSSLRKRFGSESIRTSRGLGYVLER